MSDASSSSDEGVFGLKITGVEQYWKGGAKADAAAPYKQRQNYDFRINDLGMETLGDRVEKD